MKRTSLFKALLATLLLVLPAVVHAKDYDCVNSGVYFNYIKKDGSYYKYSDNLWSMEVTYETTSYNSYSGSVEVPQKDYSYAHARYFYPLGIGPSAFRNCTELNSVSFADEPRIAYVRDYAFYGCTSLTSVSLSRSQLMVIGNYAFYNCSSLTDDGISFPSTLDSIGNYAFYGCSSLTKLDLSNTKVTSIGDYAFTYCTNLQEVILPSTVTSIGAHAFGGCSNLTTVTIPTSVTSIGAYAFNYCTNLTTINNFGNLPITEITNDLFLACSSLTSITIPSSVTSIGNSAFGYCSALSSITIPSNVTDIGNYAFEYCSSLSSITIPSNVTHLGYYPFHDCTALTDVVYNAKNCTADILKPSVNNYYYNWYPTFYGCDSLTNVTIGEGVTTIPAYMFSGYYSSYYPKFTSIKIPSSVTSIGDYAFYRCQSLKMTIDENSQLVTIGDDAFSGCGLTSIEIPSSVASIGEGAFNGCSGLTDVTYNAANCTYAGSRLVYPVFGGGTALVNVTIGEGVRTIPTYLFNYCTASNVIFNATDCTSAGTSSYPTFYGCYDLANVTIGEGVKGIPEYMFDGFYSRYFRKLTSITIPSKVTSIGSYAFYYCEYLDSIYSYAVTPPTITGSYTFRYVPSTCVLYVPAGSETAYGEYSKSNYTYTWSSLSTVRTFHLLDVVAKADPEVDGNEDGYGYMTFCNGDYTYTLPEGMTATTVSGVDEDGNLEMNWEYSAGDTIPANTAVILYGKVDEFMAMVDYDSSDTSKYGTIEDGTAPETNWLHGVWSTDDLYTDEDYTDGVVFAYDEDGSKTVDNYLFYTLNYDGIDEETGVYKDIGFYWSAEDGGPFWLAAKKAWLAIPKDAANEAKFSTFLFGENGETTGIKAVDSSATDDVRAGDGYIYNLAGQRVNNTNRRGVYIVDGKKVVKK